MHFFHPSMISCTDHKSEVASFLAPAARRSTAASLTTYLQKRASEPHVPSRMSPLTTRLVASFLRSWHRTLALPRQTSATWHRERLSEEITELNKAKGQIERLSEASDVVFAVSRAHHDGFLLNEPLPQFSSSVYAYMLGKFTMRWVFYRTAAWFSGAQNVRNVREVINPTKNHKLAEVAARHGIKEERFVEVGERLRRWFPLLP